MFLDLKSAMNCHTKTNLMSHIPGEFLCSHPGLQHLTQSRSKCLKAFILSHLKVLTFCQVYRFKLNLGWPTSQKPRVTKIMIVPLRPTSYKLGLQ